MQNKKLLNICLICDMLMLDEVNIKRLLHKFADMLPEMSREIRDAARENDLKLVNMLGHKLKGTAGNFRIDELQEIGAEINKLQSLELAEGVLVRLDDCIGRIAAEVEKLDV